MTGIPSILVAMFLGAEPTVAARDETGQLTATPAEQKLTRELGGHTFLPSHIIDNPFSETFVWLSLGLGAGEALAGSLQLNPPAITPENRWYGFTGFGLLASGGVRLLEYLSLRAAVGTEAYIGNGTDAALAVGSSARVTAGLGAKGSLPVGETLRFAATFDATYGPVYSVLIAEGLIDAINSGRISASEFVREL